MESLLVSFRAIAPMFLMIATGYWVKKTGWVTGTEVKHFNKLVFNTFMPATLFWSIYNSDFSSLLRLKYAAFVFISILITFTVVVIAAVALEKDNAKRGAMAHAAYRGNIILLGMPLVAALMPEADTGTVAVVSAITIPLYTLLGVSMLEYFRSGKFRLNGMIRSLLTNSLIIASLLGVAVKAAGIQLPVFAETFVSKMSAAATPVALLLLGAAFEWKEVAGEKRNILTAVLLRLVIFPAVMLPIAALLGFRGIEFATLIPLMASPTAVNTFNMAQVMDSDMTIAGGALMLSTAASFATLFIWISLFKHLGMF